MSKLETEFDEQVDLLVSTVKSEIFHFIVIQYNHVSVIQRIKNILHFNYPERPSTVFKIKENTYNSLISNLNKFSKGFFYLEDFENLLKDDTIYPSFNQQRDKIASYPIALIAFLPYGKAVLNECIKKIPDMWSFRSIVLDLGIDIKKEFVSASISQPIHSDYDIYSGLSKDDRLKTLQSLKRRLSRIEVNKGNLGLLNSLYLQIIQLCDELGIYEEGLNINQKFLQIAHENDYKNDQPKLLSDIYNYLAKFYWYLANLEKAEKYINESLKLIEDKPRIYKLAINSRQSNLALVYKDLGRYEEAVGLLDKALKSDIKNFGENHPTSVRIQSNLALVYKDLGRYEEAAILLEKALKSDIKNFGANHPTVAGSQSNLALVYKDLGRYEEAVGLLERALKSDIKNFGENHPTSVRIQSNLALVYFNLNKKEEALELFKEARKILLNTFGKDHPHTKTAQS